MADRPTVALLIETSNAYARGLLEGIVAYVREHEAWSIYLPEQGRGAPPPAWLGRWRGDGVIARIETEAIARSLRGTGLPVVDVSAARHLPGIPWVETDDRAIAELAAEHFLSRGFKHLAFCGEEPFNWSRWRCHHFRAALAPRGLTCHVHEASLTSGRRRAWAVEHRRLVAWVRALPKPVGIFACYDIKGQQLLDACRAGGLAVPEQVAVIAVDNDYVLCNLAAPPLSSIIPNTRRTGYLAAELLAGLMAGEAVSVEGHLVEPLGVETRQSSDVLAVEDPDVAQTLRYIREHACSGIKVVDLVKQVPLSRRALESRFQKLIGRSPHDELLRVKIERVKQLLVTTDLNLAVIADLSGFPHAEYLSVAFSRTVGVPPGQYRRSSAARPLLHEKHEPHEER